jgi:CTP:molybdopterin cytidylyltransferase MocA
MQLYVQTQLTPPTLVIMAAGVGNRYGQAKQLDGIGPNGEWLMDYTVFDAIDAGFGKIVFVVSESMMHTIDQHYRHSIQNKIDFELVVQETS